MPKFKYETNQGTFIVDSNRALTRDELTRQIKIEKIKKMSVGEILSASVNEAATQTFKEVGVPIMKGLNVAAFGAPRFLLNKYNPELDKKLFPDQETLKGKALSVGLQGAGLIGGGAARIGLKAGKIATRGASRVIPRGAAKSLGNVTTGSVAGGTQIFDKDTSLETQKTQALFGGAAGGLIPPILAGGKKVISKAGQLFKSSKAGHLADVVLPKMMNRINSSMKKLGKNIVSFAENKVGVDKRSLQTISKKGAKALDDVFAKTDGDTAVIADRFQRGIAQRREIADTAYKTVMDAVPENHLFPINKTYNTLRRYLIDNKFIDINGNLMARGETARAVNKRLIDLYDDISSGVVTEGKRIATGKVPKSDFNFYRDEFNALYRDNPTDIIVKKTLDSLYDDASNAGFEGLKEARTLQRKAFDIEGRYSRSPILKEKRLKKASAYTEEERRGLQEVADYIEKEFPIDANIIDDLDTINAARDYQKLKIKINENSVLSDLNKATSKENFNFIKSKYEKILDEPIDDIFNEVQRVRQGRQARQVLKRGGAAVGIVGGGGFLADKLFDNANF